MNLSLHIKSMPLTDTDNGRDNDIPSGLVSDILGRGDVMVDSQSSFESVTKVEMLKMIKVLKTGQKIATVKTTKAFKAGETTESVQIKHSQSVKKSSIGKINSLEIVGPPLLTVFLVAPRLVTTIC